MAVTVNTLRTAIARVLAALEEQHETLTVLDGKIGDGDLGITLLKAFRELDRIKGSLSADLGQALSQAAAGVAKVSSSSFGNLLATSLMAIAKDTKGQEHTDWANIPAYLNTAVAAMAARGKASLGDKTVLDAVSAAALAASGSTDASEMLKRARAGVDNALDQFRGKPNKIGRARIFGDRTIGLDDPGMVAFQLMLGAL